MVVIVILVKICRDPDPPIPPTLSLTISLSSHVLTLFLIPIHSTPYAPQHVFDSHQVASTSAEGYRQLRLTSHGGGHANGTGGISSIGVNGDVTPFEDGTTQLFRLSELVDVDRLSLIQRLIRQVSEMIVCYLCCGGGDGCCGC